MGVTVIFAYVSGVDEALSRDGDAPERALATLNRFFMRADRVAESMGVYKIESVGGVYMAATGVVSSSTTKSSSAEEQARLAALFALALVRCTRRLRLPGADDDMVVKVGVNSGDVYAGVAGSRVFAGSFKLMGDAVNVASRMMTNSKYGRVCVSPSTAQLLAGVATLESRGNVRVKGTCRREPRDR